MRERGRGCGSGRSRWPSVAPPSAAPAYDLGTALNRLQYGRGGGAVQASSTFGWLPICSTNGQGNASYGVCSPMTERRDWCVEATGVGGHPTTFIPLARDDWAEAPPFGGSQPGPPGAAFEEPVLVPVRGDGVYGGRIFKSWIDFGTWGQPPKDRSLRLVFSEPSWVWSNASAHEAGDRPVIPLKTTDAAAEPAMLFFDDHFLSSSHGLSAPKIGKAWLLTALNDSASDSYVGWGYPSVFSVAGGGWRMLYQGWPLRADAVGRLVLMAESDDAVHWRPATTPGCPGIHISNCVYKEAGELSFVYDDAASAPPEERLKALSDGPPRISVSADGLSWRPWGKWTSKTIDPGYSVFRNPLDTTEVVVTARPQALRDSSG